MTEEQTKLLNISLEELLEEINYYSEDFCSFVDSLNEITLNNPFNKINSAKTYKNIDKKNKRVPLSKSLDIVKEFLVEKFPPNYLEMFTEALEKGYFIFEKQDDEEASKFSTIDNKPVIIIKYENQIYDVCLIIHEFMHYTNVNENVITEASNVVSETISFFAEHAIFDFVKEKYPEYSNSLLECLKTEYEMFYSRAVWGKVLSAMIKHKMNGGTVNPYFLEELYYKLNVDEEEIDSAITAILTIALEIDDVDSYTNLLEFNDHIVEYNIASVLSKALYDLYKKNPEEAISYNDSVISNPYFGLFEALDYLNLEYDYLFYGKKSVEEIIDLNLEQPIYLSLKEDSLKELNKTYKKVMKEM